MPKIDFKYKANYYLIILIAFTLPLAKSLVPLLLGILFISSLINNNFKEKKSSKQILLLSSIYLLYLIGILYSQNRSAAIFSLEEKLSLLAVPLIFFISKINYLLFYHQIIKAFIEGCIVSLLLSLINSGVMYFYTLDSSAFFYQNIALYHHGSYLSMYLNFSVGCIYFFSFHPTKHFYLKPILGFSLIVFFSIFIALLSSKTGIISLLLIHTFSLFYWIARHKAYLKGAVAIVLIGAISSAFYFSSSSINARVNELISSNSNETNTSSTNIRKEIWNSAASLYLEAPIIGHGTGDVIDELARLSKEKNLGFINKKKVNAYNQYLQTAVALGSIGLITLIAMLILPLYFSWKNKYWVYVFFILLTMTNFLTEAMLETQSGVIFYAFFNTLFFAVLMQQKQDKSVNSIIQPT